MGKEDENPRLMDDARTQILYNSQACIKFKSYSIIHKGMQFGLSSQRGYWLFLLHKL